MTRRTLAVLLLVWEPATFALAASSLIDRLVDRGVWAVLWLVVRLAVTGVGVAAGLALWKARPGADALARWALGLALAAAMITHTTSIWPPAFVPGVRGPVIVTLVLWYVAWLIALHATREHRDPRM